MFLFGLAFLGIIAGGIAMVVFLVSLPFILRRDATANRFGPASTTKTIPAAIASGFVRALNFTGRASRLDFWTFAIFAGAVCFAGYVLAVMFIVNDSTAIWPVLTMIVMPPVLLVIPSLSMAVRRLHDVNKSGGWLLLLLVFGYFILLYWFFQPSQKDVGDYVEVFN